MKKYIIILIPILFIIFTDITKASIDIVYPKINGAEVSANSTFFIGSTTADEKLYINSQEVEVAPNGGFAHFVKLKNIGNNNFILKSGKDIVNFTIKKTVNNLANNKDDKLVEQIPQTYRTIAPTALRETPVNSGINRMSMLPVGTKLIINAQKGSFSRVCLENNNFAWVLSKDIKTDINDKCQSAEIIKMKYKKNKEYFLYEFYLTDRVPFSLIEKNNTLSLKIYNLFKENIEMDFSPQKDNFIGYDCEYKDNILLLKIRRSNNKKKTTIVIDAGHGGKELGAIGCCKTPEKEINLSIAKLVEKYLSETKGINVLLTREDDSTVTLNNRVKFAKKHDARVLVSIHSNALPDGYNPLKHRGTSVYYYHNQAKPLAQCVLNEITTQAETFNDKIRQKSLALVRPTTSVSVLVEVAYMINPYDYMLLTDKDFQQKCAKAIAQGILKYLKN